MKLVYPWAQHIKGMYKVWTLVNDREQLECQNDQIGLESRVAQVKRAKKMCNETWTFLKNCKS